MRPHEVILSARLIVVNHRIGDTVRAICKVAATARLELAVKEFAVHQPDTQCIFFLAEIDFAVA